MTKPPTQREVIRMQHDDSGYVLHLVREHDEKSQCVLSIDSGGGEYHPFCLNDTELRQLADALNAELAKPWPECQADVQDSCGGDIMEFDGFWLCWKHHEVFNTDGLHIKGLDGIRKRDWGNAPEWVQEP